MSNNTGKSDPTTLYTLFCGSFRYISPRTVELSNKNNLGIPPLQK